MSRETKVPAIPEVREDNLLDVLRAIKATVEVREGNIGNPLDQAATLRDLVALGVASEAGDSSAGTTSGTGVIPVNPVLPPAGTYNPSTDYTTPPAPTNLRASGGFTNVFLEWDGAPYRNHAYTEVWRAFRDNLGEAVLVGTTASNVYADPVDYGATYYYWVRFVSQANVTGPYNLTGGTYAATSIDVASLFPELEEEIASSQLFQSLGTRVTATETGIRTVTSVTQTQAQQIQTLASVVGGNSTALQIQSTVTDGLSAQYTVKIDNNGHVSGFGLASTTANGTPTSAFIVRADRFAIAGANDATDPLGTLTPTNVPFVVLTTPTVISGVTYPAGTWIKTAFIADATISSAKIQSLTADKITTGSLTAAVGISTGYISGGAAGYASGTGFWLGNDGGTYKFYVGSPSQNMSWNGSSLSVTGNINATSGTFRNITVYDAGNNVILSSGGINTALLGLGNFAYLNQINASNISTYISSAAIGTAYIADAAINNAKIANLSVDNGKISDLSVSKLTAGSLAVGQYIQSSNYSAGGNGFRINADGTAEFGQVTVRGNITANAVTANTITTDNIVGAAVTSGGSTTGSGSNVSITITVPSNASLLLLVGYSGDPYYISGEGGSTVQFPIGTLRDGGSSGTIVSTAPGTLVHAISNPSSGSRTFWLERDYVFTNMSLTAIVYKR